MRWSIFGCTLHPWENVNVSYLFGCLQRALGAGISTEELRFRWYFERAPRSVAANNARIVLGRMAYDALKAIQSYTEGKANYEIVLRSNVGSKLEAPLDDRYCIADIGRRFKEARRRYDEFTEAHAVARHFKGKEIPEALFDNYNFGGAKLYRELEEAVKVFDGPPL